MSIRVDPNLSSELIAGLDLNQQSVNVDLEELSTGKDVNSLGDNPSAAASLVGNQTQSAQVDQFLSNISSVQGLLQVGDSTMSSVVNLMSQAISLGVEGANGTLSASDRQSIASQMSGIMQQMVGLANTTYQGNYIFAGTNDQTPAFTLDASAPDGVTYNGNTDVNNVQLSTGQTMAVNVPGSQIFQNSSGDVFGALNQMITALQSGTGVAAANTALENAFNAVNSQRVFYGNGGAELDTAQSFLNQENVELTQQQTDLVGADMGAVASDYSQAQVQQQALLAASGKILGQPTLFDYLPT
ncbi:MAG TPA: flagellar hook-associated protein FlgL [Candidatus Baltobacteraceae bacterium]|jgi:flagellar hook-associated protein 3 FlgL|nr:flagellar hook-associated protein FlgL [Candidatus Baltobacteraceae bacterium]